MYPCRGGTLAKASSTKFFFSSFGDAVFMTESDFIQLHSQVVSVRGGSLPFWLGVGGGGGGWDNFLRLT